MKTNKSMQQLEDSLMHMLVNFGEQKSYPKDIKSTSEELVDYFHSDLKVQDHRDYKWNLLREYLKGKLTSEFSSNAIDYGITSIAVQDSVVQSHLSVWATCIQPLKEEKQFTWSQLKAILEDHRRSIIDEMKVWKDPNELETYIEVSVDSSLKIELDVTEKLFEDIEGCINEASEEFIDELKEEMIMIVSEGQAK